MLTRKFDTHVHIALDKIRMVVYDLLGFWSGRSFMKKLSANVVAIWSRLGGAIQYSLVGALAITLAFTASSLINQRSAAHALRARNHVTQSCRSKPLPVGSAKPRFRHSSLILQTHPICRIVHPLPNLADNNRNENTPKAMNAPIEKGRSHSRA